MVINKMTHQASFYLISNSSVDQYPENSLTHFTNKFPIPIVLDQSEKWEIGIESFGISANFINIKTPIKKDVPSFFITICQPETSGMNLILPENYESAENCRMKGFYLKNKFFKHGDLVDLKDEVIERIPDSMTVETDQIIFHPTPNKYWILMHQTFRENFGFVGAIFNISLDINKAGSFISRILLNKKYIMLNYVCTIVKCITFLKSQLRQTNSSLKNLISIKKYFLRL